MLHKRHTLNIRDGAPKGQFQHRSRLAIAYQNLLSIKAELLLQDCVLSFYLPKAGLIKCFLESLDVVPMSRSSPVMAWPPVESKRTHVDRVVAEQHSTHYLLKAMALWPSSLNTKECRCVWISSILSNFILDNLVLRLIIL